MALNSNQTGVLRGIIIGAVATLGILLAGVYWNPFGYAGALVLDDRIAVVAIYLTIPAVFLALSIGRLAMRRFLSSKDIDGSGLTVASAQAKLLQALLQNTLEQAVLAAFAYLVWVVVMPPAWLSVVPLSAIAFGIGRVLYINGYKDGAPARALGFTLCFFPSVAILIVAMGRYVWTVS